MKCPKCRTENPSSSKYCAECATPLPSFDDAALQTKTIQAPPKDLAGGTLFAGRYEIIEELGRGGMGIVYKARDNKLKRIVALKFLPPALTHVPELKERFVLEAQAAAALDHPYICTVHECDEAEDKTFISMAFIEGRSLKKKIESGPLEIDETLRIAAQVAEGLREAHQKGVVHRDVKSANIMVAANGQAKIMDFGLARVMGATLATRAGTTMGTIAYMSPEQARGEEVDHRTDIWSFGVVLYEMLTGRLPFGGDRDQAVIHSILNDPPKPVTELRPAVPSAIGQVVSKALEKSPGHRYQSMEELSADLKSIADGIVPEAIKARLRRAKLRRRNRALRCAGAAGLLVVLVAGALVLFLGRDKEMDSIAVLPLQNISGDPGQEYFVDGMHEELITELSKIKALHVVSRPAVMSYKNSDKTLPVIADELKVKAIVAGSALKEGGRIRISVQLIEAETERNLWAEKYDKDYRDILMLHGEVALEIAKQIQVAVSPAERAGFTRARPVDSEAQDLYLKGRYYWNRLSPELADKVISYYRQSIEKDPTYALAYAGLAETYVMLSVGFSILPGPAALPKARDAATKALELDPNLAEAYVSLGLVATCYDWDRQAAKRHFDKALTLNPNSVTAHLWIEYYLTFLEGEYREGISHLERVQELDPLNFFARSRLGFMDYYLRDYEGAIRRSKEIVDFDPNIPVGHLGLMEGYAGINRLDDAIAEGERVLELGMRADAALGELGYWYGRAGKKDKALELLSELETRSKAGYTSSFWIGIIHMGLGEMDETFKWFEKAYEERDGNLIYITVTVPFDTLGPDPRYKQLLQKMGIGHMFEKVASYKK